MTTLRYNFPSPLLASAEEFLQSQTCYRNSSSNYHFRRNFYGPQPLLAL